MAFQGALFFTLGLLVVIWCIRAMVRAAGGTYYTGSGPRCGNCGYGLSGLAVKGPERCPECGLELMAAGITTPRTRGAGRPGMGTAIAGLFVLSCLVALYAGQRMSLGRTSSFVDGVCKFQYQPTSQDRTRGNGIATTIDVHGTVYFAGSAAPAPTGTLEFSTLGVTPVQTVVLEFDGTVRTSTLPGILAGTRFGSTEATTFMQAAGLAGPSSAYDGTALLLSIVDACGQDPIASTHGIGPMHGFDEVGVRYNVKYQPGVTLGPLRGNSAIWAKIALVIIPVDLLILFLIHVKRAEFLRRAEAAQSTFEIMGATAPATPAKAHCCESMTRHANRPADRPDQPIIIAHEDRSQYAFLRGIDMIEIACCPWCGTRFGPRNAPNPTIAEHSPGMSS